jgi:hypothetical protein
MINTLLSGFCEGRLSHAEGAGVREGSPNTLSSGKDIQTSIIPGLMKTIYMRVSLPPTIVTSSALYYIEAVLGRDFIYRGFEVGFSEFSRTLCAGELCFCSREWEFLLVDEMNMIKTLFRASFISFTSIF